jgi:predicted nuclease of predicted toxin-antitoxin system
VRFYLDEDLSPRIAVIARGLGLDVVSAIELGNLGLADEEQLSLAARDGRCVVTQNRADFIRLTVTSFEQQSPHAGVLLVPESLPTDHFAAIARALLDYAHTRSPVAMAYVVDYL